MITPKLMLIEGCSKTPPVSPPEPKPVIVHDDQVAMYEWMIIVSTFFTAGVLVGMTMVGG